jgi:hypothetical protein
MPFCENCGNKLPDIAKFCSKCGEPIKTYPQEKPTTKNVIIKDVPKVESQISPESDSEDYESSRRSGRPGRSGRSGCFKRGAILSIIIIGIILLATNPTEARFKYYILGEGSGIGLEGALYDSLSEVNRKNYLLFSIYEIDISILGFGAQEKYIGFFNHFILLE